MIADWENVKEIFAAALDLPVEERDRYIQSACNTNTETLRLVRELLAADTDAGSFLDPNWLDAAGAPASSVQPGDILCNRYRIVRLIAEGGMGRVYEAHDVELNVRLALKTIHPDIAATPGVLARFRQEVRIAHRITHPNVCRTFHMDRDIRRDANGAVIEEVVFLTMEYLEGESLAQRLRAHGRLSPEEALALGHQIADALSAAHTLLVVHRDIKPANVMLMPITRDGVTTDRVVITDFGLARVDTLIAGDRTSMSVPGAPMGTLAYMAPEQIEGGQATPATDIYAFGLVLYEMVTGSKAFPMSQSVMGAMRRVTQPPPSAREVLPELPETWEHTIHHCLQVDPRNRPESALDVILQLEGERTPSRPTSISRRLPSKTTAPKRGTWQLALIIFAVMALFAIGLRYLLYRPDSKVAAGALVYLAPVSNRTGKPELDNVTQLIRAGLTQSGQVNLLDDSQAGDVLQRMTKPPDTPITPVIAREIAMRSGAIRTVLAEVTVSGNQYKLSVDVQQPDNTPTRYRNHWTNSWTWQSTGASNANLSPELLSAVRQCGNWVRAELGESASDIARLDVPPEDVTTSNWQALAEYTNAERFNGLNLRDDALLALNNAVRLDPEFALAYARMGDLLNSVDRWAEGDDAYLKALKADSEQRLTRRERDRIRGIYALDTWDYQTTESVFRDATIYYEQDYLGWFYRGDALLKLDRAPEAIQSLTHAAQLRPTGASAQLALASAWLVLGNNSQADHWKDDLFRNNHSDEGTWVAALEKYTNADYNGAAAETDKLKSAKDSLFRSRSYAGLAHLSADRGDYETAITALTQGMELDQSTGARAEHAQKLIDRAWAECKLRRYDACIDDEKIAYTEDTSFTIARSAAAALGTAAMETPPKELPSIRSALAEIQRNLPRADMGNLSAIVRQQVEGEILLSDDKLEEAISKFRKVAVLDAPADPKEYLARALLQAARKSPGRSQSAQFLAEAKNLYASAIKSPAYLGFRVASLPPGIYGDSLSAWLTLAIQKDPSTEWAPQLERYAALRPAAFQQNAAFQDAWRRSGPHSKPNPQRQGETHAIRIQ